MAVTLFNCNSLKRFLEIASRVREVKGKQSDIHKGIQEGYDLRVG